jgi:6,7-dimethyl-8-ribityllumazine synthase
MGARIGVVVSELNSRVTERMLSSLLDQADRLEVEVRRVCKVPGLLDAPLVVKELLKMDEIDAVILLGSIVKETSLEDYIFNQVISKLIDLSLHYEKPVSFGISGPGIYWSERLSSLGAEEYAKMSLEAALNNLNLLRELRGR